MLMMPRAAPRAEIACVGRSLLYGSLQWRCRYDIVRRAGEDQGQCQHGRADPSHHEAFLENAPAAPARLSDAGLNECGACEPFRAAAED
jgi:hypothetical protein